MSENRQGEDGGVLAVAAHALARWAGIDRAVAFTLLGRMWGIVSFPVTLFLITTCFTPVEQGFYYTFASLLALQVLLELGFDTVMVQFVSHEWAHLRIGEGGEVEGDQHYAERLASLVRLSLCWYAALAGLFVFIVGAGGDWFLGSQKGSLDYRLAWWLLCGTVSVSLLVAPLRGVLEGCNCVDKSQKIAFMAYICSSCAGWGAISFGAGVYTLVIANASAAAVSLALFLPAFKPYWRLALRADKSSRISWKTEFWPQQWRIGLSWLCGFFMFQSFVPFLYHFQGPVMAGKMGATLAIYTAINSLAQSWVYAAGPKFGSLWAQHYEDELRRLVRHLHLRTTAAAAAASVTVVVAVVFMRQLGLPQAERLVETPLLSLLLIVLVAMQLPNVETQAVRFRKREPFVLVSLVCAGLVIASNAFLGSWLGIQGVLVGFAGVMCAVLIPACHWIYMRETTSIKML